jgi:hypothetical protein
MKRTDLPKSFDDLIKLGDRCSYIFGKLGRFEQFFIYEPQNIELMFKYDKKGDKWRKWNFVPPTSNPAPAASRKKSR